MQTSVAGIECIEPTPDSGHQTEMDLDQDNNQNDAQITPPVSIQDQSSINVAPDRSTKKLSLEERLSRLSDYRIRETEIESIGNPTGKGGKADVVRAKFKRKKGARGKRVAVKKLRCGDSADEEKFSKEFVHEVELLARLSHKNIIKLVGFVEDFKHQKAWIVLDWEPNGNVKDMFRGLKYLHSRKPPICHGDLKSLNILVNASYRAVITDFGSSRVLGNEDGRAVDGNDVQHDRRASTEVEGGDSTGVTAVASANQLTLTGPVWSLRWAAPELVKEEKQPGLASDIWSAGWVCWEIMTDKVPFEGLKRDSAIMFKVIQGEVPLIHEEADVGQVVALCSLMTDCWRYKSEDRPEVDQCCKEVKWMVSLTFSPS
ncbi:hypothetical protein FS837_003283 [Tulasnella sp. UAMH 9824]|nr:hypothetical protein FS837_003283 [Tulasnella sp. UAMH 9824]